MSAPVPRRFLRPPAVAQLFGIEPAAVIGWIRAGWLPAVDIARPGSRRPRFVIDVEDLTVFKARRAVKPATKPARRKRQGEAAVTEYFQ